MLCPRCFDNFVYAPSDGASSGIIVLWSSVVFTGRLLDIKAFGVTIELTSLHSFETWSLVNVYRPC